MIKSHRYERNMMTGEGHEKIKHNPETLQQIGLEGLLIEDDALLADIIEEQLRQYKVTLYRAGTPEEAFVFLEGKKLDAVLIDLEHRSLDPFHLIAAIRQSSSNRKVPIIALVALDDISLLERASRSGASHFLPKPLVWSQMHQLMDKLRWRMADDRRHYRRAKATMPVLCSYDGRQLVGQSIDISSTGILIRISEDIPLDKMTTVAFPYSAQCASNFLFNARTARKVAGSGETKWTALEFMGISEEDSEKLAMWVDLFLYFEKGVVEKSK